MINNEKQYRITKAQADRFRQAIAETTADPDRGISAKLRKAEIDALKSQLEDLEAELKQYEALRSGKQRTLALDSIEDLPKTLIQARIAAGLSQEGLATRLGLKTQQIQRYEATNYRSASLGRINEIVRVLGIKLRHRAELRLVS
jgi:ribosome-binding protein aMBF1 (putative translation factor)